MAYKDPITYPIKLLTAEEALKAVLELCQKAPWPKPNINLSTTIHSDSFQPEHAEQFVKRTAAMPFDAVQSIQVVWPQPQVQLSMGFPANQLHGTLTVHGLTRISDANPLIETLFAHLPSFADIQPRIAGLPEELATFHREQETIFARREAALLEGHQKLSNAILEAEERANERIEAMRVRVEEERKEQEQAHQERQRQLEEERTAFEKQKAELDDRQRTHARRRHEELLRSVVEKYQTFNLSEATVGKRTATQRACCAAFAIAIALYATAAVWAWRAGSLQTIHWSMFATATLLFGSTLVFFIRWTDSWFRQHAEAETRAKYLEADFVRASWLVEMLFEWHKDNTNQPFPEEALKTLTAGLFERMASAPVDHPVNQLMASLGRLKSLEVSKGTIKAQAEESKR